MQINERLWNRLPGSNAYPHHQGHHAPLPPGDYHRRHHLPPGAPAATTTAAAVTASTPLSGTSSPCPAAQQPTPQRQPPPRLLSLFPEDGSDDERADHDREGAFPYRGNNSRSGWGGANPPPSREQSLRPWEWPNICRGAAAASAPPRETGQKEFEYFTPRGDQRSDARGASGERDGGPPSLEGEGEREAEAGDIGTEAAGPDGPSERRGIYGGLGHVKKRLWGSMFEGKVGSTTTAEGDLINAVLTLFKMRR